MNSLYNNRTAALTGLVEDFLRGHHCSEMVFVKLGQYYDESFDPRLMRLATGFGGGIAEAADVCGALVGGVMLIGHLYGRTSLNEDQRGVLAVLPYLPGPIPGGTRRNQLLPTSRGANSNPTNHQKCAEVVKKAADILLDILPAPGSGGPKRKTDQSIP